VIRRLLAAVILLSLSTVLHGETYEEWEKSVPHQTAIQFKNWLPPSSNTANINGRDFFVLDSPLGHLFGYLDFSAFPPSAFPLKVDFRYTHIDQSDINPTPNGYTEHVPNWSSPIGYLASDARLGDLIENREIEIKSADEGHAVPVWSIWAESNQVGTEGRFNAYSVLVEVTGHDQIPLARQCLIEAVAGGTTRNVCLARTNSGAESFVKSVADLTTVDELPTEERVYRDVRALWLDDVTLHDGKYPDSFWRKIFLGGTMVLGHAAEVQELAQRLNISVNQRILEGGLWSVDYSNQDFSDLLKGPNGQYNLDLKKGENPFHGTFDFGKKRTSELRRFSIWFLVIFTFFETSIIVGSLFLLRGYRRVFRWLLIPVSAIIYTALGLIIVHLVVDFRPDVQIFQEVDSMDGWPDSFVSADVMRLGFEDGRASFSAPFLADFSWFAIAPGTTPVECTSLADKTLFSMRQRYGRFASTQIHYWVPDESPCQLTANGGIVATRPLRGAWIWDGKSWRSLGPMEPGKPTEIDQARVIIDPSTVTGEGAPGQPLQPDLDQNFLPEPVRRMCSPRYMRSLANTDVGILLAIDDRAAPTQMVDADVSEIHQQTLLVHQFKLSAIKP
jgi:hypothetical protein